ncbi:MAG TPA: DNA/RNA nuclease SfsA [Kiloniellales bacterium]|nr:DNA/RNA nuclease SfsA [Kiloniellales bacterium]
MDLPSPLHRGRLLRRYKRFLADVRLDDGQKVTAHCANPGSMLGLLEEGAEVWLFKSSNPRRKLQWSWEMVRSEGALVPVNTSNPNHIVAEALAAEAIPELLGYSDTRREVRYGEGSRIDFLLTAPDRPPCYLEIKNVHLRREGRAEFPDCVTARGTRHLRELTAMRAAGARAALLFLVQREDCSSFAPAADLDPTYARELTRAAAAGVELLCYDCSVTLEQVVLRHPLPLELIQTPCAERSAASGA